MPKPIDQSNFIIKTIQNPTPIMYQMHIPNMINLNRRLILQNNNIKSAYRRGEDTTTYGGLFDFGDTTIQFSMIKNTDLCQFN